MISFITTFFAALVLFTASGVDALGTRPKPEKITVNIVAGIEGNALIFIAQEKGIFTKYGLEVDTLVTNERLAALVSGSAQFSLGSVSDMTVRAYLARSDVKIIASLVERFDYRLVVHEEVLTKGLRGQTIIVPFALFQIVGIATRLTVESLGLDPDKDVDYRSVQHFPAAAQVLVANAAKAGMLNLTSTYKALQLNPALKVMVEMNRPYPLSSIAARESYLAAHPDIAKRFLQALAEAIVFFATNEGETKEIIVRHFSHKDPKLVDLIYNYYKEANSTRLNLHPKEKLLKTAIEFVSQSQPKALGINPAELTNMIFVDELEKSGFLRKLRKQIK